MGVKNRNKHYISDYRMNYCVRFLNYKFCNFYYDDELKFCDVMPTGFWLPATSRNNFTTDSYIAQLQKKPGLGLIIPVIRQI